MRSDDDVRYCASPDVRMSTAYCRLSEVIAGDNGLVQHLQHLQNLFCA